jgi:hypothetical protein
MPRDKASRCGKVRRYPSLAPPGQPVPLARHLLQVRSILVPKERARSKRHLSFREKGPIKKGSETPEKGTFL